MPGSLAAARKVAVAADESTPTGRVTPPTEREQLSRARLGDLDAFGELYRLHEASVFRHAYHLLGNVDDAGDIRQETFLRAYHALPGFRERCSFRLFVLQICTNLCRDHLRRLRRRGEVSLEGDGEDGPRELPASSTGDPHEALRRAETTALVQQALSCLSASQREVIVLRDLEQLTAAETAAVMGCTPASVPVMLFRARRRLKDQLKRLVG
jgi:RNA polymerase sigma-70 factor (ECF subfamily)